MTWQRVLDYTFNSALYKAHQTSDGGYIAVGNEGSNRKIIIVKFNEYGDTLWSKYYNLNLNKSYLGFWIEECVDKGFIITGTGPGDSSISNACLLKTDSLGNVEWYKSFGGFDLDQGLCVKQLPNNGYILLARTFSYGPTQDILLITTDENGNEIWRKLYGNGSDDEIGYEIQLVGNSGFIIAGWNNVSNQSSKLFLIRTDLNGDTLWTKTFFSYLTSRAYSIDLTNDNGFIIGGFSDTAIDGRKANIVRTDSLWNIKWQKRYSSSDLHRH